jgi:hypothetical protein
MATSYPNSIDELINPNGTDQLSAPSHSDQHANANDAIEAIQEFVGIVSSEDPDSLSYKVNQVETLVANLENSTDTISELLGLEGNNDLTVYGIENPTNIDSFAKATWRTVKYNLQVTRATDVYTSEILASHDGTDIMVSETNIISNTSNSIFNYAFEENQGIISLRITPISGEISVRFIRTAVKA